MFKGMGTKQEKIKIDTEAFHFLHKEMLKLISKDLGGKVLFDGEKYGNISRVQFSEDGIPEDIIITVKKVIDGKIVNREISVKYSTKDELKRAFIENNKLS